MTKKDEYANGQQITVHMQDACDNHVYSYIETYYRCTLCNETGRGTGCLEQGGPVAGLCPDCHGNLGWWQTDWSTKMPVPCEVCGIQATHRVNDDVTYQLSSGIIHHDTDGPEHFYCDAHNREYRTRFDPKRHKD